MNSEYITEAIMERQSSVSREDLGRREGEDFKLLLFVHKTNLIVQADIRTLPILRRKNPPSPPPCTPTLSVGRCKGWDLTLSLSLSTHDNYIAWRVSPTLARVSSPSTQQKLRKLVFAVCSKNFTQGNITEFNKHWISRHDKNDPFQLQNCSTSHYLCSLWFN